TEPAPTLKTPTGPEPAPVEPAPADPAATPETPAEMDPSGPKTKRSATDQNPYKDPKTPEVNVEDAPPPSSSGARTQRWPNAKPDDPSLGYERESQIKAPDAPAPETPYADTVDAHTRQRGAPNAAADAQNAPAPDSMDPVTQDPVTRDAPTQKIGSPGAADKGVQ